MINEEQLFDLLEQALVPGMQDEWYGDDTGLTYEATEDYFFSIMQVFHERGLFVNEDGVTNAIRFATCEFLGEAMRLWQEREPAIPAGLRPEVRDLWDAVADCEGPTTALPLALFRDALTYLLYYAPDSWQECLDTIWQNAEGRYDVAVEVKYDPDMGLVSIAAWNGWSMQEMISHKFYVHDYDTIESVVADINKGLPYYMEVFA